MLERKRIENNQEKIVQDWRIGDEIYKTLENEINIGNIESFYNNAWRKWWRVTHEAILQPDIKKIELAKMLNRDYLIELRDFFFEVGFRYKNKKWQNIDQKITEHLVRMNEVMRFYYRNNKYIFAKPKNKLIYFWKSIIDRNGLAQWRPMIKEAENQQENYTKPPIIKNYLGSWLSPKEQNVIARKLAENTMLLDCNDHLPAWAIKNRLKNILFEAVDKQNCFDRNQQNILWDLIDQEYERTAFVRAEEICWWQK